jgi:diguanylate cyclase (GGDEF)-like protein
MADKPRQIILAEDEPASRVLLTRQLQQIGYEVVACCDGQEALEAIQAAGSGVVIADWMMPEIDGVELCRIVREQHALEALGMVYYILLTAHSEKENVIRGLDAGADDYLAKPYHPKELFARIRAGVRFLEMHAQMVQGQIEVHKANAQLATLNRQLERLANTDTLTGLANRRRAFERLHEAWALAERKDRPLSCIMLDIDHFKRVNDNYGHKIGDTVLTAVSNALRQQVRQYDICGRIGGEEFLVICPESDCDGIRVLAERIRTTIADLPIDVDGRSPRVTISAGVAERRPSHDSVDALLAEADAMLYLAKENGRNQVWVADDTGKGRPLDELAQAT